MARVLLFSIPMAALRRALPPPSTSLLAHGGAALGMLPQPRAASIRAACDSSRQGPSVSGVLYTASVPNAPLVQLYTKAGCSLCDVAKDVLASISLQQPHSLEAVDITDPEHSEWWSKYKYDIPVLHIDGAYWAKHRITAEQSIEALESARNGTFEPQREEPDAGRFERRRKK